MKFFDQPAKRVMYYFGKRTSLGSRWVAACLLATTLTMRDTWVAVEDGFFVEVIDIVDGKAVLNLGDRDAWRTWDYA